MFLEVDKFVDVHAISDNTYMLRQKNADDIGYLWMYLVIGSQKALLIDTSFGMGDLFGLCNALSQNKPLIVVNTHAHPDHSYGNCNFHAVHCHPYSIPTLKAQNAQMWDRMFDDKGNGIWMDITRADLPEFHQYDIIPCSDGDVFELGEGHRIEVIFTPGHDSGHICLLDHESGFLFAGDCISDEDIHIEGPWDGQAYPAFSTPLAYLDSMKKLHGKMSEIQQIFASHGTATLSANTIEPILAAAHSVVEHPENFDHREVYQNIERRFKRIDGLGNLVYRIKR